MQPFTRFAHYFLEIARQGSLRKAAEVLHISASAIDRQLLLAEQELGVALFERLPAGLRLTAAGELLLADLRRWSKDYARTLERFGELQGLRRGHVTLGLIDALSSGQIAQAMAGLCADYPGLSFSLRFADNRHLAQLVTDAEVDVALMLGHHGPAGLEAHALRKVPLGMAMRSDHPLAQARQLALGKTMGWRHIVAAAPLMIQPHVAALYARCPVPAGQTLDCNDVRMIRSLVAAGVGIAVLSELDVASDVARGELVFVPLAQHQLKPLQLLLCTAPQRQLSRAAQTVITQLRQALEAAQPAP
ncbi:LysR family transcriptional regulator [Corticibacter populi]|uniref:LysR family transcriptional regulator n=1 Tax=Corticibacter populi TaxID=1550736 RepID=A0A3M6QNX1_9BURK|nr:LysR family transcriptional regulator [Corticibacter populi]RMX04219.1 LysR family transcriptional regulator [Corticibacter populi]RZS33252.1 DNA-binding transcriptional LysR family regulator [Corticibacter populi]